MTRLQIVVNAASGATTTGAEGTCPSGFLVSVQPRDLATTHPHGRTYLVVELLDTPGGRVVATVWRGYWTGKAMASSVPNLPVYSGQPIRARTWRIADGGATLSLAVDYLVSNDRDGSGTRIVEEVPGSGAGEPLSLAVANPAAGADFADVTVPAREIWRVTYFEGSLSTDALGSQRQLKVDSSGSFRAWTQDHAPNVTVKHVLLPGAVLTATTAPARLAPLPTDALVKGSGLITFFTQNLRPADQWTFSYLLVEAWAVPE